MVYFSFNTRRLIALCFYPGLFQEPAENRSKAWWFIYARMVNNPFNWVRVVNLRALIETQIAFNDEFGIW